ncbi:programmed cell death 1 ligand 1-like isoform X2 [Girardinichthys multiradiatus]|uniref:programmed cell death 1 ligand 1-like isoform X2 n=1 Tax=Girardinichthys multiradiatus TaxID=208333 RepID=UPI001FAE3862|nr:programmed cell death 1 ligand 1-like isoform X2 [Girardinichthys multiradiatus]
MIRLRDVLSSWLTVWGFISVLEARGLPKVVGPFKPVTAEEKKDVVLQCRLEPPLDVTRLTVEWKLQEKWVHLYRSQKDDLSFQDQKFKGRTSLFHKEMVHGNISLKLTEITKEDAGNYTCRVPKLVGQVKEGTVVLSVGHREDGPENVFSIMSTSTNNIITGSALTLLAVVGYVLRTLLCRQLYRRVFRFGGGLEEAL